MQAGKISGDITMAGAVYYNELFNFAKIAVSPSIRLAIVMVFVCGE